jgi:hypothetical protein
MVDGVMVDGVMVDGVMVDGVMVDGVMVDGVMVQLTKLLNSEQSYKGEVKTHNYIDRQNQSTTRKL